MEITNTPCGAEFIGIWTGNTYTCDLPNHDHTGPHTLRSSVDPDRPNPRDAFFQARDDYQNGIISMAAYVVAADAFADYLNATEGRVRFR